MKAPPEHTFGDVRHVGASLGTVPSYSEDPNLPPGVLLSDVVPDGAAAKAGLRGGDRIIKVGSVDIRSINDLMFVLQAAKPGQDTKIVFVRDGKEQSAKRRTMLIPDSAHGTNPASAHLSGFMVKTIRSTPESSWCA